MTRSWHKTQTKIFKWHKQKIELVTIDWKQKMYNDDYEYGQNNEILIIWTSIIIDLNVMINMKDATYFWFPLTQQSKRGTAMKPAVSPVQVILFPLLSSLTSHESCLKNWQMFIKSYPFTSCSPSNCLAQDTAICQKFSCY